MNQSNKGNYALDSTAASILANKIIFPWSHTTYSP